MPIKVDASGRRWVEMELVVAGTPEQVWAAVATGPGNAGWFVAAEIEPKVGGALAFDFGGGASSRGEVTHWDPPNRFCYVEREWKDDAPPVATEITVTARSGDRCLVRMMHSLFTSSDAWDDELEGFESGWATFFAILQLYVPHFAGAPAGSFMFAFPTGGEPLPVWRRLVQELGLAGVDVGERRTLTGPEAASGRVERVGQDAEQRYVVLRLDEPNPGIVAVGLHVTPTSPPTLRVGVCRYVYGDGAKAIAEEHGATWYRWLDQTFGEGAPTPERAATGP